MITFIFFYKEHKLQYAIELFKLIVEDISGRVNTGHAEGDYGLAQIWKR